MTRTKSSPKSRRRPAGEVETPEPGASETLVPILVRVPPSVNATLKELAKLEPTFEGTGVSLSAYCRNVLTGFVDRRIPRKGR